MMPAPIHSGKVRDTYEVGNNLLMVASDRLSVFDVVLEQAVPGKGKILTAMTNYWLTQTPVREVAPNHLISVDAWDFPEWARDLEGQAMLVKKARMLPIECIVRGYLVGSGWREYQQTGQLPGVRLPEGMLEGEALPEPMFTPSTKATIGTHDENISYATATRLVGDEGVVQEARRISLKVYEVAARIARSRGILLLDTKFELGFINGSLAICDEILTPDSSRFVLAHTHETGQPPKSMDKEYVRQWAAGTGWNKQPPPPKVPLEVIQRTARIYQDIAGRLMGT